MQTKTKRLGKGLDALIPSIIPKTNGIIEHISVAFIKPNPFQPRQHFEDTRVEDLANSIKEHGLAQPIVVRKTDTNSYELIVGERRLKACKLIKLETIPAIVRNISDKDSCKLALVENLDRENLSAIEIATAFQRLISEFNYTQIEISELFSRSRSSVANILRLLSLPKEIQTMITKGTLTEGHGRALLEFNQDKEKCSLLAQTIVDKNLTVRQAESLSKSESPKKNHEKNPFQLFDNYVEKLSDKFDTTVEIKHKKNKLTLSVSYNKFKDYIAFLDLLCNSEDLPSKF